MASAYAEYQKLAHQAREQSAAGGKIDPKLMADKAAAFNAYRGEQRAAAAKGQIIRKGQVVKSGLRSKKSLQEEYAHKLDDGIDPSTGAKREFEKTRDNPEGISPREMAKKRLGL